MPANDADTNVKKYAAYVALVCLLLYLRALWCDFVNWDDTEYVINNPGIRVLDWQFLAEAFTTSYTGWWMPLTWVSLALDYHFWHLNPFGYHLTNIVLHSANCGLVVLIADRLYRAYFANIGACRQANQPIITDSRQGITFKMYPLMLVLSGFLWGIHPLRVESVAWVTERKDVLNGLFTLGSLLCYLIYVSNKERTSTRYYVFSLLLLLLSLMSKPVSVVMPAMLLVLDWFPLRRFQHEKVHCLLREKIPFFILAAVSAAVTIYLASGVRILASNSALPILQRFVLAGNSLIEYIRLSVYPVGIVNFYPIPWPLPGSYAVTSLLAGGFTLICLLNMKKKPLLLAMWLTFVLPLIPVLGFFQNGSQSHAARFTYLPSVLPCIGVAALVMAAYCSIADGNRKYLRYPLTGMIVATLLCYGVMTQRLIATWDNGEALWSRLIAIQPIGMAYSSRAEYYMQVGKYQEAADDLSTYQQLAQRFAFPDDFHLHALRGFALIKVGRCDEAVKELTAAINQYPSPNYFYHRGLARKSLGQLKEAEDDFTRAGNETGAIKWLNALTE